MRRILIIGATSAIAEACARRWAARGDALYLLGRDAGRLELIADDLRARGAADVGTGALDVNHHEVHDAAIAAAEAALGGIDVALIAHGTLPDQDECTRDTGRAMSAFQTNAASTIALMNRLALRLEARGEGRLAVISSVAGDRGRASNALYGAAKAAVSSYASALRQRLSRRGIEVITIKPGFVRTPMTAHLDGSGPLWATPDQIARGVVRTIDRARPVVYLPWFWRPIMAIIRALPEAIFKRLRF